VVPHTAVNTEPVEEITAIATYTNSQTKAGKGKAQDDNDGTYLDAMMVARR
jgi:hypothetical protein